MNMAKLHSMNGFPPEIRPNVELSEFVIMPNHIHGIIRLLGRGELHSPHDDGTPHDDGSPHDA